MDRMQGLIKNLKELIGVLYDEKEALINNNGHKVGEIVEKKKEALERIIEFQGLNIASNEQAMWLIKEINSLQETNLLLTKQALSYQEVLLESIAKNITSLTNTYSPKGNYSSSNSINFVDQSV